MNKQVIIDTYERVELLHGGLARADLGRVFSQTMAELKLLGMDVSERDVRDVLARHWVKS